MPVMSRDLYDLPKLTGTVKGIYNYFVAIFNMELEIIFDVMISLIFQPLFLCLQGEVTIGTITRYQDQTLL